MNLKFALPLGQVGLAWGLLVWNQVWEKALPMQDMPEPSPALKLLVAINAPVLVSGAFWLPHLPNPWNEITVLVSIGLLWYWVAINVLSWRERRKVCMSSSVQLRLIGDIFSISIGVVLIFVCRHELFRNCLPISWSDWLRFDPLVGAVIAWSVVLIFFFGWDFIHRILRRRPGPGTLMARG